MRVASWCRDPGWECQCGVEMRDRWSMKNEQLDVSRVTSHECGYWPLACGAFSIRLSRVSSSGYDFFVELEGQFS